MRFVSAQQDYDNANCYIMHYLNTFSRKPGAVNNSVALKSIPKLKAIFDTFYKDKPKKFIEFLTENKERSIEEIIELLKTKTADKAEFTAISVVRSVSQIDVNARSSIANYSLLVNPQFVKDGDM
jgi:hypothetical protein